MIVTEVRITLEDESTARNDRIHAYASVAFDDSIVINDMKIVTGSDGLFVAMPSRKVADHCPGCRAKNHLRARYCNHCGRRLDDNRAVRDADGKLRGLHRDIAHPINAETRFLVQSAVLAAYQDEIDNRAADAALAEPGPRITLAEYLKERALRTA